MKKTICIIFVSVFLSLFSVNSTFANNESESTQKGVIEVETDDEEMNQAIRNARASIDEFFRALEDPAAEVESFGMKVLIVNPQTNEGEHIWLSDIKKVDNQIEGSIANQPAYVTHLSLGQRYRFDVVDVSDWAYTKDGQMKGNFTMCAQFKYMQSEEVEYYQQNYGIECN
ncbi:YegJ family protein [Thorsellia kenyensis]|uniref:YegJ family protein n=1 Tax=Thorsellia kenyensis TaxID=1549888 RepID=A0ABV6CC18_9GAMM